MGRPRPALSITPWAGVFCPGLSARPTPDQSVVKVLTQPVPMGRGVRVPQTSHQPSEGLTQGYRECVFVCDLRGIVNGNDLGPLRMNMSYPCVSNLAPHSQERGCVSRSVGV